MNKLTIIASCIGLVAAPVAIAISADISKNNINRVTASQYEIVLGSQALIPSLGIPKNLAQEVEEVAKERAQLLGKKDSKAHIMVQFSEPFTVQDKGKLEEIGIQTLSRVNPFTWVVLADGNSVEKLKDLNGVRWAGLLNNGAKISKDVNESKPFKWQERKGGRLSYSVLFHEDVTFDEVLALQKQLGFELEEIDKQSFPVLHSVQLVLEVGQLTRLANVDLVRWIEAEAAPDLPDNQLNAQPLSNVDDVQAAPYNLSGAGFTVGVWEAQETGTNGIVRNTHQSFSGRASLGSDQVVPVPALYSDHATHVAGTIASDGTAAGTATTEGMAPAAAIVSWNSSSDATEMTNAAQSTGAGGMPVPVQISNHSYGIGIGWNNSGTSFGSQAAFGQYTSSSQAFDNVVINTDLVVVKSAGNDRNDVGAGQPRDCTQGGFAVDADCIGPRANAKNIITVGAMNGAAAIAGFSSYGPTDDGRIKPDLMAQGVNVFSLGNASNTDTATKQGTSMSSPVVSGVAALVLEQANNLGIDIKPAGVKAVLLQTANDVNGVGQSTLGPDFATGYGIVDAQAAVDLLRNPAGAGLAQETLTNTGVAGTYNHPFYVPSGQPEMHVTLVWTDPAGNPATPSAAQLINDLDLRLVAPDGVTTFTPWSLNPAIPGNAAVRNGGDDNTNNVEQVSVVNPVSGVWTIQVSAKAGSLVAGPQDFAIAGPLNPSTGPIASDKSDVIMVLDKSGSMNWASATPGISKMDALQGAANEFLDYMEIVGGHQVGLVQFDSAVRAFMPIFDLQALNAASIGNAHSAIGGMSGGGSTNIIAGVTEGQSQLSGPLAVNPNKAVFLFSDGRHNTPFGSNVGDIDGIMDADTDFYAIGFGTDVDSSVMPGVATNHNGLYLEEQSLTAAQLSKMFLTIAGLVVDEDIVIDPDYILKPYGNAEQSIYLSQAASSVTFATHWNTDNAEQIQLQLQGPNSNCEIPTKDHTGYTTRAGNRYRLIRVDLPYHCRNTGQVLHDGTWTLHAYNKSSKTETAKIMVLSDSVIDMQTKLKVKGNKVFMTAAFSDAKEILRRDINIYAALSKNVPSTGDSLKQDQLRFPYRHKELINTQLKVDLPKTDIFNLQPEAILSLPKVGSLKENEVKEPEVIRFVDDGQNGDAKKGDGIFTAVVELPKGLYQLRVAGNLKTEKGVLTRENWKSFSIQK